MTKKKKTSQVRTDKGLLTPGCLHCIKYINAQVFVGLYTFTFSHLADAFIQSDLQLGVHKAINLEEANIQRKCP